MMMLMMMTKVAHWDAEGEDREDDQGDACSGSCSGDHAPMDALRLIKGMHKGAPLIPILRLGYIIRNACSGWSGYLFASSSTLV